MMTVSLAQKARTGRINALNALANQEKKQPRAALAFPKTSIIPEVKQPVFATRRLPNVQPIFEAA